MIGRSVPLQHDAGSVNDLLDSPEVATLIADLDGRVGRGALDTRSERWSEWP